MRREFVAGVLERLKADGVLNTRHRILAVCSGVAESALFGDLGFENVVLTSVGTQHEQHAPPAGFDLVIQDVMDLQFADREFDFAFVSDGLHHCDSPHRGLLEMYRVSRQGVLVFESRDSFLMKIAVRLGLTQEYEVAAVAWNGGTCGGVNNSQIPNFIYRWTEREFEKTITAHDPVAPHRFRYFYGLNLPWQPESHLGRRLVGAIAAIATVVSAPLRKQRNSFAMVALRPSGTELWPWLEHSGGETRFKRSWVKSKLGE